MLVKIELKQVLGQIVAVAEEKKTAAAVVVAEVCFVVAEDEIVAAVAAEDEIEAAVVAEDEIEAVVVVEVQIVAVAEKEPVAVNQIVAVVVDFVLVALESFVACFDQMQN